jgi:TRAP-type C4-dicarboxylate transport system permease large subunit
MERWKQYGGLGGLVVVATAIGLWAFSATGGALPWAKRSAKTLQRGLAEGGGALVDLGRGIVIAGPIRKGGLVTEYAAIIAVLAVLGIALYVYVDRSRGGDDADHTGR